MKIIASNLKDRFYNYFIITVVLVISFWAVKSTIPTILAIASEEYSYRTMGLSRTVRFSYQTGSEEVEEILKEFDGDIERLTAYYNGFQTTDFFAYLNAVERGYFEYVGFKYRKTLTDFSEESLESLGIEGYPAVITGSLNGDYNIGETYVEQVYIRDDFGTPIDIKNVTFTVVASLKNDWYIMLSSISDASRDNYIYIIVDPEDELFSASSDITYIASSHEKALEFASALEQANGVYYVYYNESEHYDFWEIYVGGEAIDVILFIVSTLLCLCMMVSNSMLSMLEFRSKYSILCACGCTRRKCLLINTLTNLCPVVLAYAVVLFLSFMLDCNENSYLSIDDYLNASTVLATVGQATAIFIISELISALAFRKSFSVELADER